MQDLLPTVRLRRRRPGEIVSVPEQTKSVPRALRNKLTRMEFGINEGYSIVRASLPLNSVAVDATFNRMFDPVSVCIYFESEINSNYPEVEDWEIVWSNYYNYINGVPSGFEFLKIIQANISPPKMPDQNVMTNQGSLVTIPGTYNFDLMQYPIDYAIYVKPPERNNDG